MNLHSIKAWENILTEGIRKHQPRTLLSLFMRFGSRYPVLRPEFLKLVDAADAVNSPSEYLYRSLCGLGREVPFSLRAGVKTAEALVPKFLSDSVIRFGIERILAPHFLLTSEDAYRKLKRQYDKDGAEIILDVVGEEAQTRKEARAYLREYAKVMEKHRGGKVAVKLSSLIAGLLFHPSNYEENKRRLKIKFATVLWLAQKYGVSITLDAEEKFKWCHLIEDVFCETILKKRFRAMSDVGIALQAYRKDSFASAERLFAVAKERECKITVRVVKGAYWDTEFAIAEQNGWEYPLFTVKEETDANFDKIVSFFLKNCEYIFTAVATQNPKSIARALVASEGNFKNFEIQVLYGLGEAVRLTLCREGIPVSVYCPMGEIKEGMAYLVRRILENTAGNSCLLENQINKDGGEKHKHHEHYETSTPPHSDAVRKFTNASNTLWNAKTEKQFRNSISFVRRMFANGAFRVPIVIGGKECGGEEISLAHNSANTEEILARISFAGKEEAISAAECAHNHKDLSLWGNMTFQERGRIFERANNALNREFFAALIASETGKTIEECDGEISEAKDMLRYYPLSAIELLEFAKKGIHSPAGEKNIIRLRPPEKHPVALIIPPWNFPLAIALGMITGALMAGYSVIFKPAEEASIVGYFLAKLLWDAGIPKGVLQFVPGRGETAGDTLVKHPYVTAIGFTGSVAVAREIAFSIAKWNHDVVPTLPLGECSEKRFVTRETGGNNAIIIDGSTDISETRPFIYDAAFKNSGQKCSSPQRFIVVEDRPGMYEKMVAPLRGGLGEVRVGSPEDFGNTYGPVISAEAYERITNLTAAAEHAGARVTRGVLPSNLPKGYFIAPFIIEGLPNDHPLVQEEMFGPGFFILRAKTIQEAVEMANHSRYGLTGGICSRNEAYKEYVREYLNVVNYYENRPITGAVVGRQPFGGFGLSSTGFKAGGPFYLMNWLAEWIQCTNTMRQGIPLDSK